MLPALYIVLSVFVVLETLIPFYVVSRTTKTDNGEETEDQRYKRRN